MKVLRLPEVITISGYQRSSVLAKARTGEFPAPIRLGPNSIGWIESEILDWLRERMAARDASAKTVNSGMIEPASAPFPKKRRQEVDRADEAAAAGRQRPA